ncbi:MAG: hypothetical protein MJK04_31925 [Psychrosphaera sp.]|nr:hypothetical protein [Psychrosphaera sp.]
MNLTRTIFMCFLCLFSINSFAGEPAQQSNVDKVKVYLAAFDQVLRATSTIEDIDTLLSMTHQSVKYQHPVHGVDYDKATWRAAFVRQLNLHRYTKSKTDKIKVFNAIGGKNHVAIQYAFGKITPAGAWEIYGNKDKDVMFSLFTFTDGKISLIKELY